MEEQDLVREAMRIIGRRTSERKAQAARENGKKNLFTEETRAKLREAQAARRERERQDRAPSGIVEDQTPKRPRGRPKKQAETQDGQNIAQSVNSSEKSA